jgi:hypothetical protein
MISETYNISEFIDTIRQQPYLDIVYLAEKEATTAERHYYNSRFNDSETSRQYADQLKDFINFMRYGIRKRSISHEVYSLYCSVTHTLRQNDARGLHGRLRFLTLPSEFTPCHEQRPR